MGMRSLRESELSLTNKTISIDNEKHSFSLDLNFRDSEQTPPHTLCIWTNAYFKTMRDIALKWRGNGKFSPSLGEWLLASSGGHKDNQEYLIAHLCLSLLLPSCPDLGGSFSMYFSHGTFSSARDLPSAGGGCGSRT
ncbi:hypothetical protein PV326_013183 [Microctonus aethiopoides]|uniref:Uncharacterized protein n=1 Tax=Microctonus aethiopoides TaxID=144406 RepID=A0AA39FJU4_9HYME|nr:hypothetical protein PV326_013183 [Microctonus aethiopoides]KAK0170803.1 hypothetical protein PV328_008601 [Microctonus aethiopoides]